MCCLTQRKTNSVDGNQDGGWTSALTDSKTKLREKYGF